MKCAWQFLNYSKDEENESHGDVKFNSSDGIQVGDEVLARWMDEGWYYRCLVLKYLFVLMEGKGRGEAHSRE